MKQARLVFTALAVLMAWSVSTAVACDQDKTKASAAAVSSDASKCPYATAAQCKAAKAAAAANGAKACPYSASCPHTSAAACKAAMSTAVVADAGGSCSAMKNTAAAASTGGTCNHSSATAVTASTDGGTCGAAKSAAVTASASSGSCCASKGAAAKSASAAGTCNHGAKGASAQMIDGAGMTCSGHGMTTAAAPSVHGDCDACTDMADCEREIESAGASTQVVPLKNGVMYVYTADSPSSVHAVQAALARRNDRMAQLASTASKAHLCGSCKEMRGAAASGKLTREVVNIEGGCLTLVTSNDPSIVAKIHAMAGLSATAAKVKS